MSARLRLAAGLLVLPLAACTHSTKPPPASSAEPGVTRTTVTIGTTQPISGALSPGYDEIAQGAQAYFKYVNAAGGIKGRTISLDVLDDAGRPAQTRRLTRSLVDRDVAFAMFDAFGTTTHQAISRYLNNRKVPDVFVASGCTCVNDPIRSPYTFGWSPDYVVEGKVLGAYVAHRFRHRRIAYFYQRDSFGRQAVAGLDRELRSSQVVSRQSYLPGHTDIARQVRKLQSARPDVVVTFATPVYAALLVLNSHQLKFSPRLVVSSSGADPATLSRLIQQLGRESKLHLNGQRSIQGIVTDAYLPSTVDASSSWVRLFRKIHDKYLPRLPFDGNVEYGMASAYTFAAALARVGGTLTRERFVHAIEAGLPPGPGLVPFAFSTSSHAGFSGAQVGVIRGRGLELIGRPMTTDDRGGPVQPYTRPQPPAPPSGLPPGG